MGTGLGALSFEERKELLLPWSEGKFVLGFLLVVLHAIPNSLQGAFEAFGGVFEPLGKVFTGFANLAEGCIVGRTVFLVVFVDGEDVVGVKSPTIEFPESKGPAGATVAIGEGVDVLELVMENRGAEDGAEFESVLIPPSEKLKHERRDVLVARGKVVANSDVNGAVGSGFALVHDIPTRKDAVKFENVVMANGFELGLLFHVA